MTLPIEQENQLVMRAAGMAFGALFQKLAADPGFETLTGQVTMTDSERHQAIDDGLEEMIEGSCKLWSGALGEPVRRKVSRKRSAQPRSRKVSGRSARNLKTNSIIQLD